MRLSQLLTCCVVVVSLDVGVVVNGDPVSSSVEVYQPQYHQSVPYTGEITQNIEEGEGLQEAAYNPIVSQRILKSDGDGGNSTSVTCKRIECNPSYTQEAPYCGIFKQNISSEARGVQKLAYEPVFVQRQEDGRGPRSGVTSCELDGCGRGSTVVRQEAPFEATLEQAVDGPGSQGRQSALIAPRFSQNSSSAECSGCPRQTRDGGGVSSGSAVYSQAAPIGTSQSQWVGGNSSGHQSLTVSPAFSQAGAGLGHGLVDCQNLGPGSAPNLTMVQENSLIGNMSQVIGAGGSGHQRSAYAPTFAQTQLPNPCSSPSGAAPPMGESFHQNGVYSNQMHQVIHPGGTGFQASHFSPVFTQNNAVVTAVHKKSKKASKKKYKTVSKPTKS